MIGIIGALDIEVKQICSLLENSASELIGNTTYIKGNIYQQAVVIAYCGVGKVFAGICAQTMILKYQVDTIINIGVAGSLSKQLNILDVVVADEVVQHDMDTTGLNDPLGRVSGIDVTYFPCDPGMNKKIINILKNNDINYQVGRIATGDQFISQEIIKQKIVENFKAIACDMEGAAIAQVCYIHKIKFAEIRSISDDADNQAIIDFPTFVIKAAQRSCLIVDLLFQGYNQCG